MRRERVRFYFQKIIVFFDGMLYVDQSGSAGFFCGRNKKRANVYADGPSTEGRK